MIMLKDDVARDIIQFFEHCEGVCICSIVQCHTTTFQFYSVH